MKSEYKANSITLAGAIAMGTGVMIGAGIFALTGQIAQLAGHEPAVCELLRNADPSTLSVADLPKGATRDALGRFLRDHGHRGIREADIAGPKMA